MTGLTTVLRKETKNFTGSDRGTFAIYAIISVVWSFMLIANADSGGSGVAGDGRLWFVFFSVIVAANFSGTVFTSERVSGTLEIFITSGLPRDAILFGKTLFVVMMTAAIGLVCVLLALLWGAALPGVEFSRAFGAYDVLLYLSATFLNAAASAYFSVRMSNPRFLHFINLFMIAGFVAVYGMMSAWFNAHPAMLVSGFLLAGAVFALLARREFAGERIIRPVVF